MAPGVSHGGIGKYIRPSKLTTYHLLGLHWSRPSQGFSVFGPSSSGMIQFGAVEGVSFTTGLVW